MRNIPRYIEILILEDNKNHIKSLLKEVDNKINPYIINLMEVNDVDSNYLREIERFLGMKISDFRFPYPIYVLSKLNLYDGKITNFNDRDDIPQFYFAREMRPTRIHANISRLNIAAEKAFDYDNRDETNEKIKQYAEMNKKIHLAEIEKQAYAELLKQMKEEYE
ncbi:MAG: hypothetical protein H6621_08480 [Halobacteriovoraceae bacterium]|nr:hypothetical protein [Halobacteriovoraceae bacterium]MCB9095088.1 hypothetical protein [Halobacteriovoraceae bacterium]